MNYYGALVTRVKHGGLIVSGTNAHEFSRGVDDATLGLPQQELGADYQKGYQSGMDNFIFSFITEQGRSFVSLATNPDKRFATQQDAVRQTAYPMAQSTDEWRFIYKKSNGKTICSVDSGETWHFSTRQALNHRYGITHAVDPTKWYQAKDQIEASEIEDKIRLKKEIRQKPLNQKDIFEDIDNGSTATIPTRARRANPTPFSLGA